MKALRDAHFRELQFESRAQDALDSIIGLLGCSRHDGGAADVRLLFATSKAVPRHSTLWARALRSRAHVTAPTALMDPCARDLGTYRKSMLACQTAMLQVNLQYTSDTFWEGLARHGTKTLIARASANTLYACAKLVTYHQLASTPQTGMSLQADSALQVLHTSRLRDVLLEAVEHEAPSMNSQEVANTVWALATLDMPPAGSLRDALWTAAERVASSMNS
jgi:hypothetical protein